MEVINFKKSWSISSLKSAGHLAENKLHAYVVLSIKKSLNFALFLVIVKTKINWDCKNFFFSCKQIWRLLPHFCTNISFTLTYDKSVMPIHIWYSNLQRLYWYDLPLQLSSQSQALFYYLHCNKQQLSVEEKKLNRGSSAFSIIKK